MKSSLTCTIFLSLSLLNRYFQENWAVALYHDRFPDVRNEVREILKKTLVEIFIALSFNPRDSLVLAGKW